MSHQNPINPLTRKNVGATADMRTKYIKDANTKEININDQQSRKHKNREEQDPNLNKDRVVSKIDDKPPQHRSEKHASTKTAEKIEGQYPSDSAVFEGRGIISHETQRNEQLPDLGREEKDASNP